MADRVALLNFLQQSPLDFLLVLMAISWASDRAASPFAGPACPPYENA
jgi:hypothetical protein